MIRSPWPTCGYGFAAVLIAACLYNLALGIRVAYRRRRGQGDDGRISDFRSRPGISDRRTSRVAGRLGNLTDEKLTAQRADTV